MAALGCPLGSRETLPGEKGSIPFPVSGLHGKKTEALFMVFAPSMG